MNCSDVERRITSYLDGDLDTTTASALRGHLRTCEPCRVMSEDHARIAGALAKLPPAEPRPEMWQSVMARLADAERADAERSGLALSLHSFWNRLRARLLPVAAVAAMATVALVWVLTRDRSPAETASVPVPGPVPLPLPDPVLPPAAHEPDISLTLAAEAQRIDHRYSDAVSELLDDVAADRAHWPAARQRAFSAELTRLRGAVDAVPAAVRPTGGDPFDDADAATAQRDAREHAWQKLVTFLQRAALGEDAEARR